MNHKTVVPELRFPEFEGEWEEKKLGDVGKIRMCKRVFSSETTESGEIPFYKIGTFGKEADAYITNELYLNYRERFSFPKIGDILMSASGTLGRTVVYEGSPAYFQDSNIVWIDNNEGLITNSFLFNIYQIVRYESEGGTIQRLYNNIINETKFNKPTLPEQQKIASFLSAVDEKIQQLSRKKELLKQYKKGLMQQLFSGKLRFKDENGNDYADWEEKKLGDVCEIVGGGTPDTNIPEYWGGEIQWFTPTEIKSDFVSNSLRTITELGLQKSSAKKLPIGTILLTTRATIGEASIADKECSTNQGFQSLIAIKGNSNIFIFNWIKQNKHELTSRANGSTFPEISKTEIKKIFLNAPSFPEQQKIADFLSNIDTKIESTNQQITQTQSFKKGLLQQMFI
jgi:type I restriction enzyme S subunit